MGKLRVSEREKTSRKTISLISSLPFSTYVAPRSSHISVDILFLRFSVHHSRLAALLQCAVCERERERAGGAIGWCVGQREVSARGTSATRV